MPNWKDILTRVGSDVETQFDKLRYRLESRFDPDPIMIQPYLGYGNPTMIRLRGRVMQDNGITATDDRDNLWDNLLNSYRRFATDEIPRAVVRAKIDQHETIVTADDEGYFTVEILADAYYSAYETRLDMTLETVEIPGREDAHAHATGEVVIPGRSAEFGVISDLDDTVLRTDVLNLAKMARNTFLRNAQTRLPFPGVAAFYRALRDGTQQAQNPIYYVSSSPWNLYDLLYDFFQLRGIPTGPLFLQDLGLGPNQLITKGHGAHKLGYIRSIMNFQPTLPFVLIGDSGQHDPEIYAQIAQASPDRIKAIYIRDVTRNDRRTEEIQQLADGLDVPVLLVEDTGEAARHAETLDLVIDSCLPDVDEECERDRGEPNELERLVEESMTGQG